MTHFDTEIILAGTFFSPFCSNFQCLKKQGSENGMGGVVGVECKRKRKQNSLSVVTLMIYWSLVKGRGTKEPLDEGGRGEGKALKLNIQKIKIMAFSPVTSWQIDGGKNGHSDRLFFLGLQNHCRQ